MRAQPRRPAAHRRARHAHRPQGDACRRAPLPDQAGRLGTLHQRLAAYAELHERRRVEGDIDQQEVDRIFGLMRRGDSVAAGLPKGRSSATAERIVGVLRESDESLSAVDVAERIGISRATAQRYLSLLAHAEVVRLELNSGSTGRPEHRYRLELR